MDTKIIYKCAYNECGKEQKCEIGYWARLTCKHKTAQGELTEWYPVKILRLEN